MKLYFFSFLIFIYFFFDYSFRNWLPNFYKFDKDVIHKLVLETLKENQDADAKSIMIDLGKKLKKIYPKYINEVNFNDWVFNNAGGAMGSMFVLHISITEYLIFFGSAIGTEGSTGMHYADDYFIILSGRQKASDPNEMTPRIFKPGELNHLKKGTINHYSLDEGSFAIELAQGWIPLMIPFGILDSFTSTLDFLNLSKTFKIMTKNIIKNLLNGKF